ncbi:hypothetical protein DXG03_006257 [Asterophora parasitica]|uniref:NADP-dependent oxidoreductase domain-containing protein n=1 Tax=Asterophora parasitica TaxID=117018 RepID=A0A9P7KCC1_9AGAR|nr:hypothetical protein DXG03_006257 [Asterophora parasitica]
MLSRSTTFFSEPVVKAVAEKVGASPAQVTLSWAVQRGTIVVPKSEDEGRMTANLKVRLSPRLARLPDHLTRMSTPWQVVELSADDVHAIDSVHVQPGMHKSLLAYHTIKPGCVFGWKYDWLGWDMQAGGIVAEQKKKK